MYGINEVDAAELKSMLNNGEKLRLVDVRSEAEFQQGIIEGAEFLPLHILPLRMNELASDEKIVLYCRSGARSAQACMYLKQTTGIDAINLRGGIIGWYQSGYQIVRPAA
ncbi:rhodanese-like domain-containing protein [uncultured Thiothrix sp.]|uniref:rhodanese-like domain-containing protein n=1 Tax=uncultured Thiothrix sp. TaxID=223185 RepID=UPI002618AE75|nr:rhodanese-like domain-containing protein [uncultured Thiothrix sp.]